MTRMMAVVTNDLNLIGRDLAPVIVMALVPLVLMTFLRPSAALALQAEGWNGVNGAEQAVPGVTVLFASLHTSSVAVAVLREHGWKTWDRLRVACGMSELLAGKAVAPALISFTQITLYLVAGAALLDLGFPRSWLPLAVMALCLVCWVVAFGSLLAAVCRNLTQVAAAVNISSLTFAGLGGAFSPVSTSPSWMQEVAVGVPPYWAIRGFRAVYLEGGGVTDIAGPALMLVGFSAAAFYLAFLCFRREIVRSV